MPEASSNAAIGVEYRRPRYHPATTKSDWIAYSERLEAALAATRDLEAAVREHSMAKEAFRPILTRLNEARS